MVGNALEHRERLPPKFLWRDLKTARNLCNDRLTHGGLFVFRRSDSQSAGSNMKLDPSPEALEVKKLQTDPKGQNYDAFIAVRISFNFQQHDDIMPVVLRLTSPPGRNPAHAAFKRAEYDVALWHSVHRKRGSHARKSMLLLNASSHDIA